MADMKRVDVSEGRALLAKTRGRVVILGHQKRAEDWLWMNADALLAELATLRAVRQAEDRVVEAAMAMNDEVGHRGAWLSVPCLRAVCDAVDALRAARTGGRDA
jgi:hypothetical protein